MKSNQKTVRILWLLFALALVTTPIVYYLVGSQDIPEFDASDLRRITPRIDRTNNAAVYYVRAGRLAERLPGDLRDFVDLLYRGDTNDIRRAAEVLASSADAVELIEMGNRLSSCVFTNSMLTFTAESCIEIPRLRAWYSVGRRDYASAVRDCRMLLCLGQNIRSNARNMEDGVVSLGALQCALEVGRLIAGSPRADEKSLRALLDLLVPVPPFRKSIRQPLRGHFQELVHICRLHQSHRIAFSAVYGHGFSRSEDLVRGGRFAFHPIRTQIMVAQFTRDAIDRADQPYSLLLGGQTNALPHISHSSGALLRTLLTPNWSGLELAQKRVHEIDSFVRAHYRLDTDLQATRAMIACRFYEMAEGELPDTLDELVTYYLFELPMDPFDGQPLRYSRPKRIVYSVGRDLTDDGGSDVVVRNEWLGDRWLTKDALYRLPANPAESAP